MGISDKTFFESTDGTQATLFHQGAHLSSWLPPGREEQLFTSKKAIFAPQTAIRGGVPLIFPQFGALGPGQKHGFARTALWTKQNACPENTVAFELTSNPSTRSIWPHDFLARCIFTFEAQRLTMRLHIENTSDKPFDFTAALHTYFRIKSIDHTSVRGLQHCHYWDNGQKMDTRTCEENKTLTFDGPIDRVYFDAHKTLELIEADNTRKIDMKGFHDVVIWNPGAQGAQALADMSDDEYQNMLCIEAALTHHPHTLQAGEIWQGEQCITV